MLFDLDGTPRRWTGKGSSVIPASLAALGALGTERVRHQVRALLVPLLPLPLLCPANPRRHQP